MELFGVGVPELIFIVIIAIIVLGPKDMAKAGATIGKWLNNFVKSDTWKMLRGASKTVSTLPTRLMREANLQDLEQELKRGSIIPKMELPNSWTQTPDSIRPPAPLPSDPPAVPAEENVILPPVPPPAMQPVLPEEPVTAGAVQTQPKVQKTRRKPAAKKSAPATKSSGKAGAAKKSTAKTIKKPKTTSKGKPSTKSKTNRVKKSNA